MSLMNNCEHVFYAIDGIECCIQCGIQNSEIVVRDSEEYREQKNSVSRSNSKMNRVEHYNDIPLSDNVRGLANKLYSMCEDKDKEGLSKPFLYLFVSFAAKFIEIYMDEDVDFDANLVTEKLGVKVKAINAAQQAFSRSFSDGKMSKMLIEYANNKGFNVNRTFLSPLTSTPIDIIHQIFHQIYKQNLNDKEFINKLTKVFGGDSNFSDEDYLTRQKENYSRTKIKHNIIDYAEMIFKHIRSLKIIEHSKLKKHITIFRTAYPQTLAYSLLYFIITIDGGIKIPNYEELSPLAKQSFVKQGTNIQIVLSETMKNYKPRGESMLSEHMKSHSI